MVHGVASSVVSASIAAAFCFLGSALAQGQDILQRSTETWRPPDGTYAAPGNNFDEICGEFGDFILELSKKAILSNERICKIAKLTDTAPGAIRLSLICDDYNLAISLGDPHPYERKFREVMLLKRIDTNTLSVRKTLDGKFTAPAWQALYCPEEKQRWYRDARERAKSEARKAALR
ncbi:hypothetical protein [Bradyrhizobium sp. HKCCYLR20261]|uniref:hypothetical protein n=1 Tax=Bradyrhizobium sp. HKCCYLR20261 TaxID=3420760 RepID=UPI003EBBC6D0